MKKLCTKGLAMLMVLVFALSTVVVDFTAFALTTVDADFTVTAEATASDFNKGDSFTVDIKAIATGEGQNIGSFQFDLNWADDVLRLDNITTELSGLYEMNLTNGKFAFSRKTADNIEIGTESAVTIATATFTVIDAVNETTVIDLDSAEITPVSYDKNTGVITLVDEEINLHNVVLTFKPGTGIVEFGEVSAYAKWNAPGLWTTTDYTETFTAYPSAVADEGYRLQDTEAYWKIGEQFYAAETLATVPFTASTDVVATAVQQFEITVDANGGTFAQDVETELVADIGVTYDTVGLPDASKITPPEGMSFVGWKINDGDVVLPGNLNGETVDADATVVAQYSHNTFTFYETSNNADVSIANNSAITHGTDVTFTVTADEGFVVTGVTYKVGENGALNSIAIGDSYTIDGGEVLDDVYVEITTKEYHEVTFKAGAGVVAFDDVTYYVADNTTTLYATLAHLQAGTPAATVPILTAAPGYRLRTEVEGQWHNGTEFVGTNTITTTPVTEDAVYTAQGVAQFVITFNVGANGKWADDSTGAKTKTVDTGYVILASDVPEVVADAGYKFDAWTPSAPVGTTVTEALTYTATFTDAQYAVTFTELAGITPKTADGEAAAELTATHGTDYQFTLDVDESLVTLNSVSYSIGGVDKGELADVDGVYTIDGEEIIGVIAISYDAIGLYTVTFVAEGNGAITSGSPQYVETNGYLTQGQIDAVVVTPDSYYDFIGWYDGDQLVNDLKTIQITSNKIFTAKFALIKRTITAPEGVTVSYQSGYSDADAVYGTPVVFTVSADGGVVFGISYNNGVDAVTALTPVDG
ncbi:MAG: hypothetical protein IJC06_00365, partial [Clostridia bacterium]|nr:hypothetical protein [Clostridia bacterium]